MLFDGVKVFVQNGKLDNADIEYYIEKIKRTSKGKMLQRLSIILGEEYVDLRYTFKNYPFERIWRISMCSSSAESAM